MARIRTIKPEFPQSESIGRVSRDARLLFVLIWTLCDDAGRIRGNSRMLARVLFPYDDGEDGHIKTSAADVESWLRELENQGCVHRYECEGDSYLEVCNWLKHQKIDKPSASKHPAPELGESRTFANPREGSSLDLVPRTKDQGKEVKPSAPSPTASTPSVRVEHSVPFISLPTNTGEQWAVYPEMVADWKALYPAVQVEQQLRNMRGWCDAKPGKRKTKTGMRAFITNWLSREQNKAGSVPNDQAPRVAGRPGQGSLADRAAASELLVAEQGGANA